MATAVSRPSQGPKMKRPPPPVLQTGVNGIKSSRPSTSPSVPSKRLPGTNQSIFANSASDVAGNANNRPVNRAKKESQKSGESSFRLQRPMARTIMKRYPEPYVKTSSYILKKYTKSPPSLVIHLHPTHFRFDQQDGSFPYNSEMKVIIEHIREGTVPHDMVDEFLRSGVQFYEGCLIVKVVDHKSVSAQMNKSSRSLADENNTPFSIHNYNQHVTPSAYVPYPKQNRVKPEKEVTEANEVPNEGRLDRMTDSQASDGTQENERESTSTDPTTSKKSASKPKVFTTVLHPTPRSLQALLTYLATTPDPKAANRKQSTGHGASRTSSSSIVHQLPTISTSPVDRAPPAKRQKMLVEPQDLPDCESKFIKALAPPLYLEPVDSLEAAQDLLKFLDSPLYQHKPPSPKRRKRTVAELAADEALAAEEERFMLIMDERLEPTASTANSAVKSAVDDAGGAAPFEPRFSRFKTIENIRIQHQEKQKEEKEKRERERKAQQEITKRQEQERERRRILEQRQAEEQAKEEARRQQLASQQQNRHTISQANGLPQTSQGSQSSPVIRNQTPHSAPSPAVGGTIATQSGIPISLTASNQGAGSPPRPPSALQHAHPNVMAHPMASSRSQQSHSRTGTPQMTQGTPTILHPTPIIRNVTPTQRMSHGSPNSSVVAPTPVINTVMGNPSLGMVQQAAILQQQRRQHQQILAQQGNRQLTPQQIAAHMQANVHPQQHLQPHQQHIMHPQNQHVQQQRKLQNQRALQMQLTQQQHNQGNPPQMTPQQQQQILLTRANLQNPQTTLQRLYEQRLSLLLQQYPPEYRELARKEAQNYAYQALQRERDAAALQAQAIQHQHQHQTMMHNGMGT